ncbi:hypothetical protein [Kitasatospora sp. NPDC059571]|uniref:hypothetical protein n=1 Tax=Kitasatospora sp. NPDC059571 TaxID=3346871 RepID=UPI0036891CB5
MGGRAVRLVRAAGALGGAAMIGYGIAGLLQDRYESDPLSVLWWAVGGLLLHDGLWVPLVCLAGASFARSTPVRSGLVVAAALTAVGLPSVLRAGDDHGNPTVLPLPYLRNWLLLLAAVAAATAGWAVARRWARRRADRRAGQRGGAPVKHR